ncbi:MULTISPECIES: hypothetical protein [Streptomyces]|uniref:hypothetical protein n=1 Tax=Streptomyces TaxID=1883 RepID=UPI0032510726
MSTVTAVRDTPDSGAEDAATGEGVGPGTDVPQTHVAPPEDPMAGCRREAVR